MASSTVDKALSRGRGVLEIPVEAFNNFRLCQLADPQRAHSAMLPREFGLDLRPGLTRFGVGIRFDLTPIQFSSQRRSYRRSRCRIQVVPQVPNKLDPLLCGQLLNKIRE